MDKWWISNPTNPHQLLETQPHQWEFASYRDSFATFLAGGWGSGKSYALLQWLSVMAHENPPGTSGMVILPTYQLMEEFLDAQLLPSFSPIIRDHSRKKRILYLSGGRRLLYRSGHVPQRIELSNLCYMGVDEAGLLDSSIFYRAVARLRDERAKRLAIGMTGVPIWGWLRDEFEGRNDSKRRIFHVRTDDNKRLHPDAIHNLRDACPGRLAGMYIEGQFVAPGGSVYPELNEDIHLVDWKYNKDLETGVCVDFSPRTPHVLIVQLLPPGTRINGHILRGSYPAGAVVIGELHPDGSHMAITTERLCELIKARGYRLEWACPDPAGKGVQATSGVDEIAILRRSLGTRILTRTSPRARSIPNGIEHVKRMLDPLEGPPRLYFQRDLAEKRNPRAVWPALRAYAYEQGKDRKPVSDNPEKDGITDHAADCIRYMAVNLFPVIRLSARVRSIA